jgi:hypothetical protein
MDLAQAFFLLQSLRQNIPNFSDVEKKWVDDFHSILNTVEKETGSDLSAFRVQQSELHHPVASVTRGSRRGGPGQVRYSERIVIERTRLLHKLDAVLSYFQYTQSAGDARKQSIGFKAGA